MIVNSKYLEKKRKLRSDFDLNMSAVVADETAEKSQAFHDEALQLPHADR